MTVRPTAAFAQFEREVTGERIRDKIAASKKKGMWMGGTVSLGYEVCDRKLVINESEAVTVRMIFREFLNLGSVQKLAEWLRENNIKSRQNNNFLRGALCTMLRNPHYLGQIRHKKSTYPGEHMAIIDQETWDKVQTLLNNNIQGQRPRTRATKESLFTGIIFDKSGTLYTPTHTNKNGRRYRYYTSQAVIHKAQPPAVPRIPAHDLEQAVIERILGLLRSQREILHTLQENQISNDAVLQNGFYFSILKSAAALADAWSSCPAPERQQFLRTIIDRVILLPEQVEIRLRLPTLIRELIGKNTAGQRYLATDKFAPHLSLTCPFRHRQQGRALRLIIGDGHLTTGTSRQAIIRAIGCARRWYEQIVTGEATCLRAITRRDGIDDSWAKKVFPLAFLSPPNIEVILNSNVDLTLKQLRANITSDWSQQNIL